MDQPFFVHVFNKQTEYMHAKMVVQYSSFYGIRLSDKAFILNDIFFKICFLSRFKFCCCKNYIKFQIQFKIK